MCKEIQVSFTVKFSNVYSKHWDVKEWYTVQLTELFPVNRTTNRKKIMHSGNKQVRRKIKFTKAKNGQPNKRGRKGRRRNKDQ